MASLLRESSSPDTDTGLPAYWLTVFSVYACLPSPPSLATQSDPSPGILNSG